MNIVLDLDETLVSVTLTPVKHYDFRFSLQNQAYYVRKRPYLDLFLKYIFKKFQSVSVWTAATKPYAIQVINGCFTQQQRNALAFLRTRDDLNVAENGNYTKPLQRIFKSHSTIKAHNTIMIDDRRTAMSENLGNAIIVPAWKGSDDKDKSLAQLIIVLNGILANQDQLGFHKHKDVIYLTDITT